MGDGHEQGAISAGKLTAANFASGEAMNRAFLIILIPVLLVAIGYVVVFRAMGVSPAHWKLILVVAILGGALRWLSRRAVRRAGSGAQ